MAQLIHGTTINGHIAIHAGNLVDHSIATTTYVNTQIANLVNSAPAALDTLNELAAALGNDASFSSNLTNTLAGKLSLSGGTLTGKVLFPSAVSNRPQFPGGILGLDTGDGNFDIWGISRDYYPSHSNASNAWGLRWNGDNNDFEFVGGGSNRVVLDMDGGNLTASGIIYASGGNSSNWNTAYGWGNHASAGYLTSETIGTGNTSGVAGAKYQINETWLRVNSDNRQFQIYGNSRSVIFRTDGITNDHGGGAYPYIFYYGGSSDGSRRVIFETNGDIWMSWAGDWISTLLAAKQNASTAITTSNIGSQSVNYASSSGNADTLDSYHASQVGNRHFTARGFTVDGDANTYYPVLISGSGNYAFNRYSIYRHYSWTAPDTWYTASHKGGLTFDFEWSGDPAWGGNDHTLRVVQFTESYSSMVAGLALPVNGGVLVWLRGGGAYYECQVDAYPVTPTVYLSGFTGANGAFYDVRTDTSSNSAEILAKFAIRSSADLYDNGNRVATQSWVGSQGYLTSGSLSGYATQSWVNSQGFLTSLPSHNHDDRYYTEGESDSRFTRNLGQQVNVGNLNDLDGAYTVNLDGYGPINGYGGPDTAYNASLWGIGNSGRGAQIYLPYAYDQMYFRRGAGGWSSWFRVLNTSADPYPSAMDQYVRSSDSPTFANLTVSGGGAYYGAYGNWTGEHNKIQWHSNNLYLQNTGGGSFIFRRSDGGNIVQFDNSGNIFPSQQSSYYLYQANSGLWTNGNFGASGDLYLGTRSTWLSSWLNQSVQTGAGPTFSSVTVNGVVGNWGGQTRDKLRVWDGSSYTIGMKSGYDYGHLGNDEYAMSFQMNNNSGRGFWWGDEAHSDDQGAASLTTDGRMVIAKSLSIGEGETVVSPSSIPLYVVGTTSGSDVFAVDGVNGRLFSVTDDLSDSLFSVNTIAGLPVIEAYSNNVVTIGKFGTNAIYVGTDGRIGFGTTDFSYTASDNTAVVSSNPTNNRVFVNGSIQLLGNNDAIVFGRGTGSFLKDEELAFGWGGGWYMTDSSYIRSRGSKSLHMNTASVDYVGSLYLESGGQGAHLQPNTSGSYGSLQVTSTRNSWSGIHFTASGNTLMMNDNESGHHQQGVGWKWRWYNGQLYVSRGSTGGSTEYTVWDSGNLTNLNQLSNGPGYITSSSLSGYATQSWVQSQGYLTASGSFLPISGGTLTGPVTFNDATYLRGSATYGFRFNNNADTLNNMTLANSSGNLFVRGQVYVGGNGFDSGTQLVSNNGGTWSINISGDAATLSGRSVGNSTGNVAYFDSSRNLYVNNPESYSGEVRLGAAWGRGGVYASSTLSLGTSASEIHFVFSNGVPIKVNSSGSLIGDGTVTLSGKSHYLGVSGGWDGVGFGNLTNLHFQGHNQFWIGAGNAYWYRGGISTEHDLLITTMQGYDSTSYYRGITFAVDINGNGSSGGYRLGRWQTYGTTWGTARLQVDASLSVGYGARGTRAYDEAQYPRDRGVWAHGRGEDGYGEDRWRDHLFSPTANGGGPWGSFASLEVSSIYEGNSDIPALFRMHQWGSGAAEFWKPQGTVLYLRESPGGGGSWFTQFQVQGSEYVTSSHQAYSYQGHSNVAGTGNASYHPSGIYSTGTNWLYGTVYLNNNSIQDAANIYNSGWYRNYNQTGLYSQTYDNHFASYDTNYWRLASGAGLEVWSKSFGAVKGYVYFDGSSFGLLNSSGQWAVRTYGGSETQLMYNGSWRGIAQSNGFRVNGNLYIDVDYGYGVVGVYTSTRYQGVFAMGDSYKLAADGSSTGSLYGLAWSHPNAGGVAGNLNTHGLLVMENGTFLAAVSGSIRARDDVRAPALYDSGSRVAISRGEGRNYVDYSRYVYNNGAYSGSGWIEPSDLGVRYANSSGNSDTVDGLHASSFTRKDTSGQYLKAYYEYGSYLTSERPVDLVDQGLGGGGLRVDFMHPSYTGSGGWNHVITWSGYNGYNMYQLGGHYDGGTGTDLWVRSEANHGRTSWTSWRRLLNTSSDPYAANMNQYVRTSDAPTFNGVYTNDWFRANGCTGLYFQTYGYGLRAPECEGNSYGNVATYGTGRNGWSGYGIGSQFVIMGRVGTDLGMHDNSYGWGWYWHAGNRSLGIGESNTSSSYRLYVTGAIYATDDIVAYSDRRKKTDIITIDNALEKVAQMRGVYYTKIDSPQKGRQTGVIAQEINEVLPEVVTYAPDVDEYGVAYGNIAGVLIEAIKEQQRQIADLKEEIKKLKGE